MKTASLLLPIAVGALLAGCGGSPDRTGAGGPARASRDPIPRWALAMFPALPAAEAADPVAAERIALGRRLYFDTGLSPDGRTSCNTCHPLADWGAARREARRGAGPAARPVPTVYNVGLAQAGFFRDGRASTLELQAQASLLDPQQMAMLGPDAVVARIESSPAYRAAFRRAFPGERQPVTFANVGRAIAAFERTLLTPSRWDRFLAGDARALTAVEKAGFATFVATGCSDCHHGVDVGGRMYQRLGTVRPWPSQADSGRYLATKNVADLYVFKVASLRNVEKLRGYFHDGTVRDLSEAVRLMARHQLGQELADGDVEAIVAWLRTLTGDPPATPPAGR